MARRVILHIGAPKSGTTFLQTALWRNRRRLAEDGVLVPGERLFDHNRAATAVRSERPFTGSEKQAVATWERLRATTRDWPGTVVFTNEWFGRATESQATRAVEALRPAEVHVVFTARAFTEQFPAAWQESLKLGRSHTMEEFAASMDDPAQQWSWPNLDPALVLPRWAVAVPPEHVHVVTVRQRSSDPNLLWRRFAGLLGIDPAAYDTKGAGRNQSLSAESARLLQRIGPLLREAVDADRAPWYEQYRWIRRYVSHELLVPQRGSKIGLSTDMFSALDERAAQAISVIRAAGYDVVGDLDELFGGEPAPGSRRPDEVTSDELLDVAVPLITSLLRRVREETNRAEQAEQRIAKLEARASTAGGGTEKPTPAVVSFGRRAARRARRSAADVANRVVRSLRDRRGTVPDAVSLGPRARPRLCILMTNVTGHGGRARTVINLANHLVEHYDIEIIGLIRWRNRPSFTIDPRINVRYVVDVRPYGPGGARRDISRGGVDEQGRPVTRATVLAAQRPSKVVPLDPAHWESTDEPLIETIQRVDADVLIGTTPSMNRFIGEYAPPGVAKVGQDHMNFHWRTRTAERREFMARSVGGLDAFVTLTEADARDYRSLVPDASTIITSIPNGLAIPAADEPADLTNNVVVGAGRLEAQKAFARLIDAYAPIAAMRPDWRLEIYGSGSQQAALQQRIDQLGIGAKVKLCGFTKHMPEVLSASSIFAMTSVREGFGMVLIEAMSRGLPVVSYDCPRGPAEIVRDGVNGRLIPDGDTEAFTAALLELMDDDELRRRMGAAALKDAQQYEMPSIVERWTSIFGQVGAPSSGSDAPRGRVDG